MALSLSSASSQYAITATAPATAAPLTMACWFYPTDLTNFQVLMSINNSGANSNNFRFSIRGDSGGDPLEFLTWGSGGISAATTSAGASGTSAWYHGCGVRASSSSGLCYFNGGSVGTDSTSNTPSGLNDTEIGAYRFGSSSPSNFFSGRIAEAAIWTAALDAAEVAALAKGYSPQLIRPQSLVVYVPGVRDLIDRKGTAWTNTGAFGFGDHAPVIMPRRRLITPAPTSPPPPPSVGAPFYYMRHVAQVGGPLV